VTGRMREVTLRHNDSEYACGVPECRLDNQIVASKNYKIRLGHQTWNTQNVNGRDPTPSSSLLHMSQWCSRSDDEYITIVFHCIYIFEQALRIKAIE